MLKSRVLDFAPLVVKYTWNKSEDVKSEAWLAVIEANKLYDSTKGVPYAGYVKSRVKYSVWNTLKKQKRQWMYEMSLEKDADEKSRLIETLPDTTDIQRKVENSYLNEVLRTAIGTLPERQRNVIIKSMILNYRQVDIASEMGIAPQAVFNLRNRGLTRLKKMIEKNL